MKPVSRYSSPSAPPHSTCPFTTSRPPASRASSGWSVRTFRSTTKSAVVSPNGTPRRTKGDASSRPVIRGSEKLRWSVATSRPEPPSLSGGVSGCPGSPGRSSRRAAPPRRGRPPRSSAPSPAPRCRSGGSRRASPSGPRAVTNGIRGKTDRPVLHEERPAARRRGGRAGPGRPTGRPGPGRGGSRPSRRRAAAPPGPNVSVMSRSARGHQARPGQAEVGEEALEVDARCPRRRSAPGAAAPSAGRAGRAPRGSPRRSSARATCDEEAVGVDADRAPLPVIGNGPKRPPSPISNFPRTRNPPPGGTRTLATAETGPESGTPAPK